MCLSFLHYKMARIILPHGAVTEKNGLTQIKALTRTWHTISTNKRFLLLGSELMRNRVKWNRYGQVKGVWKERGVL